MKRIRKTIDTPKLVRAQAFEVVTRADDQGEGQDERTLELAFASGFAVERYFGTEVLEVTPKAARLERVEAGAVPLLLNHDSRDQIGIVESVAIGSDGLARAAVRFGKSARATEIRDDVADGIRRAVSFGYVVHRMELSESSSDDGDVYRVTDWELLEISLVSMPADPTVGVGREAGEATYRTEVVDLVREEVPEMIRVIDKRSGVLVEIEESDFDPKIHARAVTPEPAPEPRPRATDPEPSPEPVNLDQVREAERKRISDLDHLARDYQVDRADLETAISEGWSVERFVGHIRVKRAEAGDTKPLTSPATELGLSERELRDFSITRAVFSMTRASRGHEDAGLEWECSRELAKRLGRQPQGILIPYDVLARSVWERAAIAKGGSGANVIGTDHLAGSFIEILRNRALVGRLGATMLPGLVGDVDIPRQTGAATAAWVGEGAGSGDTPQTFDKVTMTPKTVRARSDMTRKMLLQSSPAIEGLVRTDLARVLALALDAAALAGSGSGSEPTGVLNTAGIGSVTYVTTDGGTEFASVVELETDVAAANADVGELAYATTPEVRGRLKSTYRDPGSGLSIWRAGGGVMGAGDLNGYAAWITNGLPKDLGVGSDEHPILFGFWPDLLIGEWGALDLTVDEVTLGDSGGLVVRAFMDADVAVRHAPAFSASQLIP